MIPPNKNKEFSYKIKEWECLFPGNYFWDIFCHSLVYKLKQIKSPKIPLAPV